MEFEFGRFGWSISRLSAIVSNVRRTRLQKAGSTDRNYFKNRKVLVKPAELEIFILKIAVNQCLSFLKCFNSQYLM